MKRWADHSDFATVPVAIAGTWSASSSIVLLVAGVVAWTFVEYWLHRCLHSRIWPAGRRLHVAHHQHPREPSGGTLYTSLALVAVLAASIASSSFASIACGFLAGYLAFITMHFAMHAPRLRRFVPRRLEAVHDAHHHAKPAAWFGVTTTFWDHVFRTAA